MEDSATFVAELEQAAVAGAEGATWHLPELADPISTYSTFSVDVPSKPEPTLLPLMPSSPPQHSTSLCSISTDDYPTPPPSHLCTSPSTLIPLSPGSPIVKPFRKSSNLSLNVATRVRDVTSKTDAAADAEELVDLRGTTAARSRKMTEEERRVMLHKRRLRNRASAARSREKRSRTLNDLSAEVEELMKRAEGLKEEARRAVEETRRLKARNVLLSKENELLKAELRI